MLFINNVTFLTIILNGVLCFIPKSRNDISLLSAVAAASNGIIDGTPTTISKPNNNLVRGIIGGGGIGVNGGGGSSSGSITPTEVSGNNVRGGRDVNGGNADNFLLQDTIPYEKNDRSVYDPGVNDVVMGQHHHYPQQQHQQQPQNHHYYSQSSYSHTQQNPTVELSPSYSLLSNQYQNHPHHPQQQTQQQQQHEIDNRQTNSNVVDNENALQLDNSGVNILNKLRDDIKEEEDIAIKSALLLQLLEKSNLDSPLPIIYVENDDDEATKIAKLQQQQRLWQTTGIGDYDNENDDDDSVGDGDDDNDAGQGGNDIDIGNDINDDSNQMLEKRSGRYYRRYPWKRQNTRYRTYEADTRYLCNPSREDVFKLLVGLHENRNGNHQRVINFCNKKRPAKAIFTNIRFLG